MIVQSAVFAVAVLSTLIVQLQPNSSTFLLFHGSSWSCTSRQEWAWIAATGLLILLLHVKPTRRFDLPSVQARHKLFLWFLALNFVWFATSLSGLKTTFSALEVLSFLGAKSAWPGVWNLAFIVFPVKRSSEILALSHKDTLFLHVWAGHAILFWLSIHTVFLSMAYAIYYDFSVHKWFKVMRPSGLMEYVDNFTGWLGFAMFLALWLTSLPKFRKRFYESFSFLHLVTAALFILSSNLHYHSIVHFVQPAFAAWIAERLVRRISTLKVSVDRDERATVSNGGSLVVSACRSTGTKNNGSPELVSLTMNLPPSWDFHPGAGMFVYLKCPSISSWQLHPFSISAIDTENATFSIHIKALGDWTNQFVQHISHLAIHPDSPSDQTGTADSQPQFHMAKFEMCIEGPYYSDHGAPLNSDQNCLFVVGGVGLTGLSEALYLRHGRGQSILLVWIVRTKKEMEFLAKDLLNRLHPPRATTQIMVFITRENEDESQHQSPSVIADRSLSLQTGYSWLSEGGEAATGSTKSFPVSVEEKYMYPGMRTMVFVSVLGVALSFLLARMICCNRTVHDLETGQTLHICSAVPKASTTTSCSNSCEDGESDATCCTAFICFYCFRGLPVVFLFFVAPLLPILFAWVYPRTIRWLCICRGTRRATQKLGDYAIPHQCCRRTETVLENTFNDPVASGGDINLSSGETSAAKDDLSHQYVHAVITNLNHTTIAYRKPDLSEIVEEFCALIARKSEDHDLVLSGDNSEDKSAADDTTITEEAAVFVCGSESLAENLVHEVKMHNDSGRVSKPTRGPNARVHLSVWTATGAY